MLGTFGRGFWVVDDVSFLREAGDVTAGTEAHLFPVKDAFSYRTNTGTEGPRGAQAWNASNPPYGVPLTAWVDPGVAGRCWER